MAKMGIDQKQVIDAAIDLVNREGVQALSLGKLAENLHIRTPSLYNHVQGLDGLIRGMRLRNVQNLAACFADAVIALSGEAALRALMGAYRAYILNNPGLYMLSLQSSLTFQAVDSELTAAENRSVEIGAAVVSSLGYSGEEAIHVLRAMRSLVHGFASLEIAQGFGLSVNTEESFQKLVEIFINGIGHQFKSG